MSRPTRGADPDDPHAELPADPDIEVDSEAGRPRPAHLSAGNIALVAAGGACGTGLRYAAGFLIPGVSGIPIATLGVNIVGAFLLGLLLESLAGGGANPARARRLRLGLGTGALGGFTTYSTLATDTVGLVVGHHPGLALGYAAVTLLVGALATMAGIGLGARLNREPVAENR